MSGFGLGARCAAPSCPVWSVVLPVGLEDLKRNFYSMKTRGAVRACNAEDGLPPASDAPADGLSTRGGSSGNSWCSAEEAERTWTAACCTS